MKTIVCSGGWRTGSTLVYNAARLLIQKAGIPCPAKLVDDPTRVTHRKGWSLYKCHVWVPTGAEQGEWIVLHTTRDPVEMAGSYMRIKGATPEEAAAEAMRQRVLLAAITREDLPGTGDVRVLPYEDYYGQVPTLVRVIAGALGLPYHEDVATELEPQRIREQTTALEHQSPDLWQPDHVGAGLGAPGFYRATLDAPLLARLCALV